MLFLKYTVRFKHTKDDVIPGHGTSGIRHGVKHMEFYLLEYFLAVRDSGTLSSASEQLHITEPTLSRAMKRLEEEFSVPLFLRRKNRIDLTETGRFAADCARRILDDASDMIVRVRDFDLARKTIRIGSCAPAAAFQTVTQLNPLFPGMSVSTGLHAPDILLQGLERGEFDLIILPAAMASEEMLCRKCGSESLFLSVPKGHDLARKSSVSFEELNGITMLLYSDIGFWHDLVRKKMPDSRFLMQNDRLTFLELIRSSGIPAFSTKLAKQLFGGSNDGRGEIPISDPEATAEYYCVCRKEAAAFFHDFYALLEEVAI